VRERNSGIARAAASIDNPAASFRSQTERQDVKEFAFVFLIATIFAAPAIAQEPTAVAPATAQGQAAPHSQPVQPPTVQISQLGQRCVTPGGSCPVAPRPLGSQCFCGTVRGQVR